MMSTYFIEFVDNFSFLSYSSDHMLFYLAQLSANTFILNNQKRKIFTFLNSLGSILICAYKTQFICLL